MNIKNKNTRFFFGLVLVLACAAVAVFPFFGKGFIPTHDGEYHIIRFMEFYRMLSQGYVFPRWAPTINSGYGLPLFEFMYPFPNYVSAIFHLCGMGFVTALKVSSACSYLIAVLFCFLWLNRRFSVKSAVVGSIAVAFVPYWFVELYVRGSIGELWAITFLFAALWSIEKKDPLLFTFFVSIIVLCHNGMAMIFIPLVLIYASYRINWRWMGWIAVGIGLASWFWLPALAESRYMIGLNTVGLRDHFASIAELLIPSWGTEFSGSGISANKMSLQIGIAVFLWMFYTFFRVRKLEKTERWEWIGMVVMTIGIISMTLPWSLPIWNGIGIIQYLQYPWRLLVWLLPMTAWMAAMATHTAKKMWIPVILVCISILCTFSYTRGAIYAPRDDAYYQSRQNFTDGTSSMGNSLSTIWTPWKETRSQSMVTDTREQPIAYETIQELYLDRVYSIRLMSQDVVRFHILYFPGWHVYVDGKETSIRYTENGTIDVDLSAGIHSVEIIMKETPIRMAADMASWVCFGFLCGLGILSYRNRRNRK